MSAALPMPQHELGALLNRLLEAERAGAKLLAAYVDELAPRSPLFARLSDVPRDEARNCAVLIHYLLEAGMPPSTVTGDFYRKGLAIREWRERLEFLNRGQAWVARRIAAALPGVPTPQGRRLLQTMHDSHLVGTPEQLVASNAA
jgi:hypothetical protein